jgi:hypothetical protein
VQPIKVQTIGSGTSTPIFPDYFQNPFAIGIGVNIGTGTGNATYSVEHTFDQNVVYSPLFNGISTLLPGNITATAIWFQNSGINGTSNVTSNGNYAFPVAAIRLNTLSTSTSTTVVNAWFIQASNAP